MPDEENSGAQASNSRKDSLNREERRAPSLLQCDNKVGDEARCQNLSNLQLLFDISRLLDEHGDLSKVLNPVLKRVLTLPATQRAALVLRSRESGVLNIEHAVGLSEKESVAEYLLLCQPLFEKVFDTGNPQTFADIKKEIPLKERYALSGQTPMVPCIAMICHPVFDSHHQVIGVLAVERWTKAGHGLIREPAVLSVIASMISQAVKLRHEIFEENSLNAKGALVGPQAQRPKNMIGNSTAMQDVYRCIEQVAPSMATVLIRGESGVGKELVAKALHEGSDRRDKVYLKFNCAALPDSIIESELFGHEKGAFTGANVIRKGRFESAHGGTIFIDEIGDISPVVQIKLLRVLQEREFERVGSQTPIPCDVRVVTATSRNLEEMMAQGKFREDLYYRLNVFPIYVPPLRQRKSDLLQLVDFFIERYATSLHKNIHRVSTAAIDLLASYHWPGNVRELENCIERAVIVCAGNSIEAQHLPPTLQKQKPHERTVTVEGDLQATLDGMELEMIVSTLKNTHGNIAQAAIQLGLTERKMGLRIKKFELDPQRYKG